MKSTETLSFEMTQSELAGRRNTKWSQYKPGVIPASIADMDFSVAPPIQAAIDRVVSQTDYGYPMRNGGRAEAVVASTFANRMKSLYGLDLSPALVLPLADLVQATNAALVAFSDPGDGVILQTPNYPPFREAINTTKRKLLALPMRDDGTRYTFDVRELAALSSNGPRVLIVCNPHNPTGRVFSRAELLALGQFADEHDLVVVSDEIHSDLVYPGLEHIPFASLSPTIAARTITLNSATKSFNIPGLRCGVMAFGSEELRNRFLHRIPVKLLGQANVVAVDATVAAWSESQSWLDAVMAHLLRARDRITDTLASEAPKIRLYAPEATYLAWLDCRELRMPTSAFDYFLNNAGIGFSAGETFDPACTQFVRLNFATSMPILDRILESLVAATRRL